MLRNLVKFLLRHWLHVLLAIPGVLAVTVLHEAAHALAVLLQGGTITEFVWLPSPGRWGYTAYQLAPGAIYSSFAISVAPYLMWCGMAAFAAFYALMPWRLPFWLGSTIYFWLFFVPLADIANAAFPYLAGKDNDFLSAFGPPSLPMLAIIAVGILLSVIAGFFVQWRLYRDSGLRLVPYLLVSGAALVFLLLLSTGIPAV